VEKLLRLVVQTPSKQLVDMSDVQHVLCPSTEGFMTLLPGHAPLWAAVATGVLVYTRGNMSGFIKVAGGVVEVSPERCTFLVDVAEEAAHIDLERAKRALERAEGRLAAKELSNIDVARAQAARDRAKARIEAALLHQQSRNHDPQL